MSFWQSLWQYDNTDPLIFTSPLFWFWFGFIVLTYQFLHSRIFWRNIFLSVFSLYFYYKSGGYFFVLLIFSTIVDYYIGNLLYKYKNKNLRLGLLVLSLVINLGLLAYYKYAYFFTDIFNQTFKTNIQLLDYLAVLCNELLGFSLVIDKIILPVGISFYTFQTLSYSIDIYKNELTPAKNVLDFAFFVSFFPQLVAGPIVRASDFIPQIYEPYTVTVKEYNYAIFLIINGLIKKILISDYISTNFVDRAFESPEAYAGLQNLLAVYGYALQIYCDFSGYTDIAIGISLLLGFRLIDNFNSPYVSASITEFWRRWHISLSSWLRDYLYIPLGGNRNASVFTYMSLPIMLYALWLAEGYGKELDEKSGLLLTAVLSVWAVFLWVRWRWLAFLNVSFVIALSVLMGLENKWFLMSGLVLMSVFWVLLLIKPSLKKSVTTYANLSITMLLGGLWHGASVRFIIWGALHGIALAIHKFYMDITGTKDGNAKGFRRFIGQFITFHFVCFCWIFFRAKDVDTVWKILKSIAYTFNPQIFFQLLQSYPSVFSLIFH